MTREWSEIRNFYVTLVSSVSAFGPMLKLIREIEGSPYADGLFAWTAMHDLCIAQTPINYPYYGPYLRISPCLNAQLEFRYIDTIDEDKQWHRTVAGHEGFARLKEFLQQLNWFTDKKSINGA